MTYRLWSSFFLKWWWWWFFFSFLRMATTLPLSLISILEFESDPDFDDDDNITALHHLRALFKARIEQNRWEWFKSLKNSSDTNFSHLSTMMMMVACLTITWSFLFRIKISSFFSANESISNQKKKNLAYVITTMFIWLRFVFSFQSDDDSNEINFH